MRWEDRRESSNIEDRRGQTMRRGAGIGAGSIIMALVAIFLFGQDPAKVMSDTMRKAQSQPRAQVTNGEYRGSAQEERVVDFVSTTLADTEDTWSQVFAASGDRYVPPKLVLYRDMTPTACGTGQAASGPFYCPGDQKVYLDLSFLNQLQQMGASGDFAVAYVLAHEVGHHIQTRLGIASNVRRLQGAARSKAEANQVQVAMELQADCLAGVWAHHNQKRTGFLEQGDIEEAIQAAAAVGDDTIMQRAGRTPRKENFTHGSSQQRMDWFSKGIQSGDLGSCMAGIEPR